MASRLQREIGKRRPFDSPELEAYLNLVRTAAELSGELARLFRRHGLTESSYNVLRILRGGGRAGRASSEIGRDMVVRVPDITRLVDRLVQQGLAERHRSEEDRRVVRVRLTRKGRGLVDRLDEPLRCAHREQLGHMSRAELAELSRLLERARERRAGGGSAV